MLKPLLIPVPKNLSQSFPMSRMCFFFWVIMKNFLIRLCILYSLDSDEDERKSHKDNKHGKKNAKSVSFVGKKRARDVLENDDDL